VWSLAPHFIRGHGMKSSVSVRIQLVDRFRTPLGDYCTFAIRLCYELANRLISYLQKRDPSGRVIVTPNHTRFM
jgi:hypothetical protein